MKLVSTNPSQSYNKIDSVDISTYKKIVSRVNKAHNTKKVGKNWESMVELNYFENYQINLLKTAIN